jgi:cytoskeletal protein CcmA (bactofilin family)
MRYALISVCIVAMLLALAEPAEAADIRTGDSITVGAGETINDDLYAFGNTISVLGNVRGDAIAAGATVDLAGQVGGSVEGAGNSLTLRGPVTGSVRVAGNTIAVDGRINGDLLVAGSTITLGGAGRVGRDLVMAVGTATLVGETGRNVRGSAGALTIDGHVTGNIDVEVTTLRLTDRAVVDGSISYASATEANVAPGAKVSGGLQRREPTRQQPAAPTTTTFVLDWLRNLVGVVVLGLIMLALVPAYVRRATSRLETNPLSSLGIGCGVLIVLPILALFTFIVGALIGGWWIGFVALALYVVALAVALPIVSLALGDWILGRAGQRREPAIALVLGAIIILLIGAIPAVGGLIVFLAVLVGLGAVALAMRGPTEPMTVAAR